MIMGVGGRIEWEGAGESAAADYLRTTEYEPAQYEIVPGESYDCQSSNSLMRLYEHGGLPLSLSIPICLSLFSSVQSQSLPCNDPEYLPRF